MIGPKQGDADITARGHKIIGYRVGGDFSHVPPKTYLIPELCPAHVHAVAVFDTPAELARVIAEKWGVK